MPRRAIARRRRSRNDRERLAPGPGAGVVQATRRPSPEATVERARRLGHRAEAVVGTVQRQVDLTTLTATQNNDYYVDPNDRDVLYSDTNAAAPKPRELYFHSQEATTANGQVDKWKPNVRLVSSQERQNGISTQQALAMARTIENIDVSGDLADLPSLGILGKNDCDNFALQLTTLIARENAQYAQNFVGDQTIDQVTNLNAPNLDVGDRMKHVFQGQNLACGHHGATIVAQDGNDDVTLEAHVSQNIQAPKFHIRQGAVGFIADNNANQNLGTKAQFRFWQNLDQQTVQGDVTAMEQRFDRMSGRQPDPFMGPEDFLSGALGMSQEPGRRIARERIRRNQVRALQLISDLVGDVRWDTHGLGWNLSSKAKFWNWKRERNKAPSGIESLRTTLNGHADRSTKLARCRDLANERLAKDRQRSQATTDLYNALSAINPDDPDVPALTLALNNAEQQL